MSNKKPDPSTLDLQQIIALWNAHTPEKPTRSDAIWDRLGALTESRAVLIVAGDRIDGPETADALKFAKRHGVTPPGAKSATALRQELEHEETEADPITRAPLWKGKTPDGRADWSPVSRFDREAVGYGAEIGELRGVPSPQVIWMLSAGMPPIPELRANWAGLLKAAERDPEKMALVVQVRARLIVKPAAQESAPLRPFAEPVRDSCTRCGADRIPGPRTTALDIVPPSICPVCDARPLSTTPPLLLLLAAGRDQGGWVDLAKHLSGEVRAGAMQIVGMHSTPAGQVHSETLRTWVLEAKAVAFFISADTMSDPEVTALLELAQAARKRIIPIVYRAFRLTGELGALTKLPQSGVPICSASDRDSALAEVARGLKTNLEL